MSPNLSVAEQVLSTERLIALELRREVSRQADDLADKATELIEELQEHQNDPLPKAQLNGLLSIANTTQSIAPIVNFLRRQGARREAWQRGRLANTLIQRMQGLGDNATYVAEQIQQRMRERHKRSGQEVETITDKRGRLPEIHHLLALEFIQAFVVGYLYKYSKE